MKLEQALVLSQVELYLDTFLMWLSCPALTRGAAPGRFLMVRCGEGLDPLLPRPFSFHRFRQEVGERQFALLYDVRGRGTRWLSARRAGDQLSVFGPLGRGYAVSRDAQNLLLVGGGLGTAALVALADEAIAGGKTATLLQGARATANLYPPELLPPEVEVISATDDGSTGHKGYVTDLLLEHLSWADQLFACGPTAMLATLSRVLREADCHKPAQALLEEHMACGTGICYGCAVFTRRGVRLVCKDGPRFDVREVFS